MAVQVDLVCSKCEAELYDQWSDQIGMAHRSSIGDGDICTGLWERLWTLTRGSDPMCHPSERCVVYISEHEGGKVQYPGNNNAPIPDRLVKRGYQKMEMSPRQVAQFERKHGVVNERLNYNNGNGMHS